MLGAAAVAVSLFAPQVNLPVPARLAGLGLFALATLCVILALFVVPDGGAGDTPGVDSGHGFSYWISLLVIIAGLVLSLMRFQATGGQLPGALGKNVPDHRRLRAAGRVRAATRCRPRPATSTARGSAASVRHRQPPPPGTGRRAVGTP